MPYTPTTWVESVTRLSAANMNIIEAGIDAAHDFLDTGGVDLEPGYAEKTSDTTITATTPAGADTIVSTGAMTFDGSTPVIVEGWVPAARATSGGTVKFYVALWDGASELGEAGGDSGSSWLVGPLHIMRRVTPSAASHTFTMRAYVTAGAGTAFGGPGGATQYLPAFIRVSLASPTVLRLV